MSIDRDSFRHLSFLENGHPGLNDMSNSAFEIPAISDRIELVARPVMDHAVGSIENLHKVDVTCPPIPSARRRKHVVLEEFRLVFSQPNSFGDVFIRRPKGQIFTEGDDRVIINGKVAMLSYKEIADKLPGMTPRQANHRWEILVKNNPHLPDVILTAWEERSSLLQIHAESTAAFDPLSLLQPELQVAPRKIRKSVTRTNHADAKIQAPESVAPILTDRIFVLYKAGCTPGQIATEMGLSPALVKAQVKLWRKGVL